MKLYSNCSIRLHSRVHSHLVLALVLGLIALCGNLCRGNTLTNELLLHLSFDATNADGVFPDDSGNGDNGTNMGASIAKGFIGAGAVACTTSFDGSVIDYVTLGYPTNLQFGSTESFSISFWTSFTNQAGDIPFISNKDWNSSGDTGWGIFTEPSSIRINVTDANGDKQSTEDTPDIKASGWHHVCVTFDRSAAETISIYIDGSNLPPSATYSLANVTGNIDTVNAGLSVNIGQDGTGFYTDGGEGEVTNLLIDDIAAWGRVLSPSEVSAIYSGGLLGSNILQVVTKLPPSVGSLSPGPGAIDVPGLPEITATITDGDLDAVASTVKLEVDGAVVNATVSKTDGITQVDYVPTNVFAAGSTHSATLSFSDNNTPPDVITTNWSFVVLNYPSIVLATAQPAGSVNTNSHGFQMRVSQISDQTITANDGTAYGDLAAGVSRAEAQLAGVLVDPMTGQLQTENATPGPLPNGAYAISNVINFTTDGSDQGNFTSANGYPKTPTPGLDGVDEENLAVEIVTYLYLPAGYYEFGCNSADGFRVTIGTNVYDAFSTQVGLFDTRSIPIDTTFGFNIAETGYYATRIVWFRVAQLPDNQGEAGLEFYSVTPSGEKVLINDLTQTNSILAYQSSSAPYGPYVSYAGPASFLSPYLGNDWGSPTVQVKIQNGSSAEVESSSVKLSVDGNAVNATVTTNASGATLVSYTPPGLQLKRTVHTGLISYSAGGTNYSETWQFNCLRNYSLTNALYYEQFDELADGQLPPGWSQTNWTTPEEPTPTTNFDDYNSAAFLGWTVLNVGDGQWGDWGNHLYVGLYQELNGAFFDAVTNPLLENQFLYCESDNRSGQQIQYVYTTNYNFSGKTGIVLAFDSAYTQNQNNIDGLEYTLNGGATWQPLLYLVMGETDTQGPSMIVHNADTSVNVAETMAFGISPRYTNSAGQNIGGSIGAFVGAPITQALAPFIEGRVNDEEYESKRFEVLAVPGADNQPAVQFRMFQVGTGSWYWGIDNWGLYSVPSLVQSSTGLGRLTAGLSGENLVLTWTAGATVAVQQSSNLATTNWVTVSDSLGVGTLTVTNAVGKPTTFYRLISQ